MGYLVSLIGNLRTDDLQNFCVLSQEALCAYVQEFQ